MKITYRKLLNRLGLQEQFKTEVVDNFLITYEPATDIGRKLFLGESFEKEELAIASQYINNDSIILDIGANIGLHSLKFSTMAKNGLVIACEPQPITFNTLQKNIAQNDIKNIIPLNIAIAQSAMFSDFFIMTDDAYSSLIDTGRKKLNNKVKVLCSPIDGLLGNIKVDFVKIDVEGMELNVLQSMHILIQQHHPVIFCEIYKGKIDFNNPHDTIKYLRNYGYLVYRVIDGALVEFKITDKHDDNHYNYFFVYDK